MPHTALPTLGRSRVVVEGVRPRVDDGRLAAERVLGDEAELQAKLQAELFADGHDDFS